MSFGSDLFPPRFPNTTFSSFFAILAVLGAKMEAKMGEAFRGENPLKSGLVAKRAQRGDEGRKMEPKCSPRVPKWSPRDPKIEDFGVKGVTDTRNNEH